VLLDCGEGVDGRRLLKVVPWLPDDLELTVLRLVDVRLILKEDLDDHRWQVEGEASLLKISLGSSCYCIGRGIRIVWGRLDSTRKG